MENISWLPEVMDGVVAGKQVGGTIKRQQRGSRGNPLSLECMNAQILVMVLFYRFARSYYCRKLSREFMGWLYTTPYNYVILSKII